MWYLDYKDKSEFALSIYSIEKKIRATISLYRIQITTSLEYA